MEMVKTLQKKARHAGRPRAVPEELESVVAKLYDQGYGYRAIAHMLNTGEYGLNPHFSSIRQCLIRLGRVKRREA